MKNVFAIVLLLTPALATLVGSAAAAETPKAASIPEAVPEIPNYKRIAPALATAGQPSPAAVGRLREMGFRTVVNLRTDKEGAAEERTAVEAQGLRYVNVPVTAETLSMADAEAVRKVLDDPAAGPVLLHCASSNRVGAVYALLQARKGKSPEEAQAAGREAGLTSPTLSSVVRRLLGVPEPAPAAASQP